MGFTRFAVMLYVTVSQLVSGMRFMTPEPDSTPTSTPDSNPLGDLIHAALQSKEYLGRASAGTGTTTNPTQAVPGLGQTESAATVISPGLLTTALSSVSASSQTGPRNGMSLLPIEEETTTTLITTTTITTMHMPVQCNATLSAMEDTVESPDPASSSTSFSPLECTYSITVYAGYGVEIQVRKVNLSKEESLIIMGHGGTGPELLANETLMREGQVIRSTTNQVYIHYRSLRQTNHGMFSLHYQAFLLSCPFPRSPAGGGVTVTDIHPGGQAHFHCDPGFQVRGHEVSTCVNTTEPHWSTPEPQCVAVSCGGWIRNATVGRVLSPTPPSVSNHSNGNNLSCHWLIEAKEGHRIHLHFERIALDEDDDKLIVRSGNSSLSPPLFDSDLDDVPERGLLSESSTLYLELTADSSSIPLLLALRYEAFDDEHCWEPYMPHGNFSSSDITYQLGTTVTFTCSPGFVMEQGSGTIECVDPSNPHWNDSEPVCRALCGGELTEPAGTILSPDWPQSYSKGLDCVWQIHGNEEKRIELDVQILNIRHSDVLTVFDGRDLMSHVIRQYLGSRERFQVVSVRKEVSFAPLNLSQGAQSYRDVHGESTGIISSRTAYAVQPASYSDPRVTGFQQQTGQHAVVLANGQPVLIPLEYHPQHQPHPPQQHYTEPANDFSASHAPTTMASIYQNFKASDSSARVCLSERAEPPTAQQQLAQQQLVQQQLAQHAPVQPTADVIQALAPSVTPAPTPCNPSHFMKGAIIQLATGELKRVEDLQTQDFVRSAEVSGGLKIDSSMVVDIRASQQRPGLVSLHFTVGEQQSKVTIDVPPEHPFFVFGQGWSSCSPERTAQLYGLACHHLQVGDVCVSVTLQQQQQQQLQPQQQKQPQHNHSQQQQQQQNLSRTLSKSNTAPGPGHQLMGPPAPQQSRPQSHFRIDRIHRERQRDGEKDVADKDEATHLGVVGHMESPIRPSRTSAEHPRSQSSYHLHTEGSAFAGAGMGAMHAAIGASQRRWSSPGLQRYSMKGDEGPRPQISASNHTRPSFIPQEVKLSIEGRSNAGK